MSDIPSNSGFLGRIPAILTVYSAGGLLVGMAWSLLLGMWRPAFLPVLIVLLGFWFFSFCWVQLACYLRYFGLVRERSFVAPRRFLPLFQVWNWLLVFLWCKGVTMTAGRWISAANPIPVFLLAFSMATLPFCFLPRFGKSGPAQIGYAWLMVPFVHAAYGTTLLLILAGFDGSLCTWLAFGIYGVVYLAVYSSANRRRMREERSCREA